jgi:hypothetical protein
MRLAGFIGVDAKEGHHLNCLRTVDQHASVVERSGRTPRSLPVPPAGVELATHAMVRIGPSRQAEPHHMRSFDVHLDRMLAASLTARPSIQASVEQRSANRWHREPPELESVNGREGHTTRTRIEAIDREFKAPGQDVSEPPRRLLKECVGETSRQHNHGSPRSGGTSWPVPGSCS